ncbi:hypothetical protein [Chitinophaga tropicalis]|uniref:ABM domain-containing protein n=1 Tax=Chitinophaga tropicalis TaxID=2683588 RepID=A0A7K1U5I4_9BACT|nr:hypothetical protein [Chitinophaga tropicalis]MVT09599.1 hypothetical protein [Chitinophaga tropicalis]
MKVVKVTYTVEASFVKKNQENIQAFINDLQQINHSGLRYHIYLANDGKTFFHFAEYNNDTAQKTLLELPSFIAFQQQRDQHLETEPKIEPMEFVDATYTIFN